MTEPRKPEPLTESEERVIREWCAEHPLLPGSIQMDPDDEPCQERWLATIDAARASLAAAERERDEARLKANILADGAFHDGKERSRLTDWTTELRGQVSAQRALTGSACGTKKPNAPCVGCYSTPCVCRQLEAKRG